jgi:hypothetical protein
MSVSSLSSITTSSSGDLSSIFAERRKNMQALDTALQGGDLQAAQSAFAAVQQTLPSRSGSASGSFANGLQAVGDALQSGDLAGAQKAFAALQQERKAHGHHHHGARPSEPAAQ